MKPLPLAGAAGLLAFASLLGPIPDAHAQTIYRCGNTYSSTPCEGGSAVNAADPRSAEQARAARQTAKRDAQQGRLMQSERERAEQAQARAEAANANAESAHARALAQQRAAQVQRQREQAGGFGTGAPAGTASGKGTTGRKGCVPSEKLRCPDFVAAPPAPAPATK